ncbi:hypothetical protein ASD64_10880 [Mesorhizobium sp. Root157]|nr:hypothetical protein ASD64_10880 [Mesorhizobium sp. Root157]
MPVALAAAWFLVMQSVLGAFASAAGPQSAQLDAFGNVICTHGAIGELPDSPQQKHVPSCCVLGCNLAASVLAGPPAASALSVELAFEAVAFVPAAPDHLAFERPRSPSNPRAPPAQA